MQGGFEVTVSFLKTKEQKKIKCNSYESFLKALAEVYELSPETIQITKPPIKDQRTFQKHAPYKAVTFKGQTLKSLDEKAKRQEAMIKKQAEAILNQRTYLEVIQDDLFARNIPERPFVSVDQDFRPDQSFCEQLSCMLYLMSPIVELKNLVYYTPEELKENEDQKLLIQDFLNAIRDFQGTTGENSSICCPSQWASSVLVLCQDYFEFPFPVFPFKDLVKKIFFSFDSALDPLGTNEAHLKTDFKKSFQEIFIQGGIRPLGKFFKIAGLQLIVEPIQAENTKQRFYPSPIMNIVDYSYNKRMYLQGSRIFYGLPSNFCQEPKHKYHERLLDGCEQFFDRIKRRLQRQERKRPSSYGNCDFDYKNKWSDKAIKFNHIPQYLFIPINRTGAEPTLKDYQKNIFTDILGLSPQPKGKSLMPIPEFVDLQPLCSTDMKRRLFRGNYWRNTWLSNVAQTPGFEQFLKEKCCWPRDEIKSDLLKKLQYEYFDLFLLGETSQYEKKAAAARNEEYEYVESENCYHNFYFDEEKNIYETADYRLVGGIYHRGDYFHNLRPDHLKDQKLREIQIQNAKRSLNYALKINRLSERIQEDSTGSEQQLQEPEDAVKQEQLCNKFRLKNVRKQKGLNKDQLEIKKDEHFYDLEALQEELPIVEELDKYIHNCRGEFQTIVYRKGRRWIKIFGAEITETTVEEAMSKDKWGEGEWTPLLLMYKQLRFPSLKSDE